MNFSEKRYKQKITLGQSGNALVLLIAICLILFVGLAFLKAIWYFKFPQETALFFFNKDILSWFVMPASFDKMISRPWTVLTHPFVHDNIWKIIANMLWLYCFGFILQDVTGNRKIIPIFLYGAFGGAVAFLLAYNFLPSLKPLALNATAIGASAGVMAIAIATTLTAPGYRLFPMINGGIPLGVLTAIYVISDLATIPISDTGNLIAILPEASADFYLFSFYGRDMMGAYG